MAKAILAATTLPQHNNRDNRDNIYNWRNVTKYVTKKYVEK